MIKREKGGGWYEYSFQVFAGFVVNLNKIIYESRRSPYLKDIENEIRENRWKWGGMRGKESFIYTTVPLKGPPIVSTLRTGWN
jgi:hypothetical protein